MLKSDCSGNFSGLKRRPGCIGDHRRSHRRCHTDLCPAAHFRAGDARVVLAQKTDQSSRHKPLSHRILRKLHLFHRGLGVTDSILRTGFPWPGSSSHLTCILPTPADESTAILQKLRRFTMRPPLQAFFTAIDRGVVFDVMAARHHSRLYLAPCFSHRNSNVSRKTNPANPAVNAG
jgi:hypothetical protein